VVDDEHDIRRLIHTVLTAAGYTVFTADTGEHALRIFHKHANEITLLVADVVAPGMSGPMVAERILGEHPHLKVLFISGYDHSNVVQRYVIDRGREFLAKPFDPADLVAAVGKAIGPSRAAHG
jgi:DNA-binding NtrC family response regulator